jgi:hypothetical protein
MKLVAIVSMIGMGNAHLGGGTLLLFAISKQHDH